jgi:hypothetical protein
MQNTVNKRVYIGQTSTSLKSRFAAHMRRPPVLMAGDLQQFGRAAFTIQPIFWSEDKKEIDQAECMAILEGQWAARQEGGVAPYNTARGPPTADARYPYLRRGRKAMQPRRRAGREPGFVYWGGSGLAAEAGDLTARASREVGSSDAAAAEGSDVEMDVGRNDVEADVVVITDSESESDVSIIDLTHVDTSESEVSVWSGSEA